jgi:hypothetical protein
LTYLSFAGGFDQEGGFLHGPLRLLLNCCHLYVYIYTYLYLYLYLSIYMCIHPPTLTATWRARPSNSSARERICSISCCTLPLASAAEARSRLRCAPVSKEAQCRGKRDLLMSKRDLLSLAYLSMSSSFRSAALSLEAKETY